MVRIAILFRVAIFHRAFRDVRFDADDRLDVFRFARVVEFDGGEHRAMIGERERGLFQFRRARDNVFGMRQSVEETVFAVDVEMNKVRHSLSLERNE